jgi:hypothetical protein
VTFLPSRVMKRPQQRVATAKMAMAKGIADDDRDVRSTGLIFLLDKGSAVGWRNAETVKKSAETFEPEIAAGSRSAARLKFSG